MAAAMVSLTSAAEADTTVIRETVSSVANTPATVDVPVPAGVRPTSIDGILTIDQVPGGTAALLVNGRTVATVPARAYQRVSLPLRRIDVEATQTVELGVRYDVPDDGTGCQSADPASATLRDLTLTYTGTETAATSLGDFFPPSSARVDVLVPSDAADDLLEAGLVSVAALSSVYPEGTPIALTTGGIVLPRAGAGQRVVRLERGDGAVQTSIETKFGLQTLTLTGSGRALVDAAHALGSEQLALADSAATQGLAEVTRARDVDTLRTFDQLGFDQSTLSGFARSSPTLEVSQDAFGGPIDSLQIQVAGTHSAVPEGGQAKLDTYLNGFLLDSQILDGDPRLAIDAEAPDNLLGSDNELEFSVSAVPAGGCLTPGSHLPLEVFIDAERSSVTATRGLGTLTGFDAYPQVLGGRLPVAIRPEGAARTQSAIDAALIISSLQRAAAAPLDVSLMDADEFVNGSASGLLVGADYPDSVALAAPLKLSGMRLLDFAEATFEVGTNQPFATLESVQRDGRGVLMLGAWSPNTETDPAPLSRKAAAQVDSDGWAVLSDDMLVAGGAGDAFTLDSGTTVVPRTAPVDDLAPSESRSFAWWYAVGLAILLLLLVVQLVNTVRRNRAPKPVAPQLTTDADAGGAARV